MMRTIEKKNKMGSGKWWKYKILRGQMDTNTGGNEN